MKNRNNVEFNHFDRVVNVVNGKHGVINAFNSSSARVMLPDGSGKMFDWPLDEIRPVKTRKAYKLFRVKNGKLYPLFVDAKTEVMKGLWLNAKMGERKASGKVKSRIGDLAFRAGWHSGSLPLALHIGGKSDSTKIKPDYRPSNQVWAEVEVINEHDWQTVANERADRKKDGSIIARTAHITDQLPKSGCYEYKTNSNMVGKWIISGEVRVNRILSDDEVSEINGKHGLADLPRLTDEMSS